MRFKTNDKSNKSFSDNVFTSFIIVLSNGGLFIAGSKNSNGVILKYSQISKNAGIEGKVLPDVIDWIYPCECPKSKLN